MSERHVWEPQDYIAKRNYCPPSHIAAQITSVVASRMATEALLLTFSAATPFRSLCFVAQSGSSFSRQLERSLKLSPSFVPTARSGAATFRLRHIVSAPVIDPNQLLTELSALGGLEDLLMPLSSTTDLTVVAIGVPSDDLRLLWGVVFLVNADRKALTPESLGGLVDMLNASSNASVYRDQLVVRRVEKVIREHADSPDASIDALLRLAVDVTRSCGAALFECAVEEGVLGRRAFVTDRPGFRPRQKVGGNRATVNGRRVRRTSVEDCYGHRRTAVLELQTRTRQRRPADAVSTWRSPPNPTRLRYEVTIPIPSAYVEAEAPLLGVLSVFHDASSDADFFGSYDFALLRNVALRLSILIGQERRSAVTESIAELARARHDIHSSVSTKSYAVIPEFPTAGDSDPIPPDLAPAISDVSVALKAVADATQSHSATLRLITTTAVRGKYSGRRLYRAIAHPVRQTSLHPLVIPLDAAWSANAWAVRHGEYCYLTNVDSVQAYSRYEGLLRSTPVRPRTKSSLTLPIFVDGFVVGTVNFESQYENAYQEHVQTGRLLAEQIAILFSTCRRGFAEQVLSLASSMHRRSHVVLQVADELKRRQHSPGTATMLSSWLQGLSSRLAASAGEGPVEGAYRPFPSTASVADILAAAVRKVDTSSVSVSTPTNELLSSEHLDSERAELLFFAFVDLLQNVGKHGSGDGLYIEARAIGLGGRSYLEMSFLHKVTWPVQVALIQRLYRVPIRWQASEELRAHVGGFSTGVLMRALQGDAYFRALPRNLVESILTIPRQA